MQTNFITTLYILQTFLVNNEEFIPDFINILKLSLINWRNRIFSMIQSIEIKTFWKYNYIKDLKYQWIPLKKKSEWKLKTMWKWNIDKRRIKINKCFKFSKIHVWNWNDLTYCIHWHNSHNYKHQKLEHFDSNSIRWDLSKFTDALRNTTGLNLLFIPKTNDDFPVISFDTRATLSFNQ